MSVFRPLVFCGRTSLFPSCQIFIYFTADVLLIVELLSNKLPALFWQALHKFCQRSVLVHALYMHLGMRMQTTSRFLRLDGNVDSISSTTGASIRICVLTPRILARSKVQIKFVCTRVISASSTVAIWTIGTNSHAEDQLTSKQNNHTKAVYTCQRIASDDGSAVVV